MECPRCADDIDLITTDEEPMSGNPSRRRKYIEPGQVWVDSLVRQNA